MPIPPLYGHEGIRNRLVGAIASGRLPQALLLEGPAGVGKQRLGLWLAQALVCERAGERAGIEAGEGCGECQQCKLVLNLSHPDVHWFVPLELSKKGDADKRSEEHTSELQSRVDLVCRLLLEKKKTRNTRDATATNNDTFESWSTYDCK